MKTRYLMATLLAMLATAALLFFSASPSMANETLRKFKTVKAKGNHNIVLTIYRDKEGSNFEFRLQNNEPEPYVATISLDPTNLEPSTPLPFKQALEPNMPSELPVFRLTKSNPAEPANYAKLSFKVYPQNPPAADAKNITFTRVKTIQAQGGPDTTLSIYKSEDGYLYEFRAQNRDSVSYALEVSMQLDNMRSTSPLPYKGTLAANMPDEVPLFRLVRQSMDTPASYKKLAWYLNPGTETNSRPVVHDGIYSYPWPRGKSFTIDNGFNGYGAHQGQWGFAVDFKMPEGSPITAAREGRVIAVQTKFSKGGNDPSLGDKANYVFIQHPDGSIGRYLHIRKNGATVRTGQEVAVGDLIAYSGNVGWSTDPHLHFDVVVPDGRGGQKTVPFVFKSPNGRTIKPVQGLRLEH